MRESRTYGSVRGARGNSRPYRERPELLKALTREQLEMLLELVRAKKARLRMGSNWLPPSAVADCVSAVDDKLMSDIVADARRSNDPGFLKPEERAKPVVRGSGWSPLSPLENSVPGIKYVDQQCDVQDALDRAERMKGFGLAGLGGPRILQKGDE